MLNKEGLVLLRHYIQEGLSKTAVAQKLGISRRTVQRYTSSDKQDLIYGPRPPRPSKLDLFKAYLQGRLEDYPELSGVRLLAEVRALGYQGGYTTLKDHLRTVRPKPPAPTWQRFEVEPGHQAQVDFATFKTSFGTVYALLAVLSWSRTLWVRFVMHQDQLTVLGGLHRAFWSFGGVPRTVLFDRMRTAVAGSGAEIPAVFNAEMLRFASHYGFSPRACRPYRAKTKGRVERAVSYLRRSFFYGRNFRDLDDLNAQCASWLAGTANLRVHGTTGEIPIDRLERETAHLLPLPEHPYIPMLTLGRRTTRDGYVSYNGNDYSVPERLGRADLQVRATLTELQLLRAGEVVAVHPLVEGRGQRVLATGHRGRHAVTDAGHYALPDRLDMAQVERRSLEVYERVLS